MSDDRPPSPAVFRAFRDAVLKGRRMRDYQNLFFRTKSRTNLMVAQQHEREFDELSLAAVRLEARENNADENGEIK